MKWLADLGYFLVMGPVILAALFCYAVYTFAFFVVLYRYGITYLHKATTYLYERIEKPE